jgi:hypothetical protein
MSTSQPANDPLLGQSPECDTHHAGVFLHVGKISRSEYPSLPVAVYRVKYLTDRAMWIPCHDLMLKIMGSFFNTIQSIPSCLGHKRLRFFKCLSTLRFHFSKGSGSKASGRSFCWRGGWLVQCSGLGECRRSFAHRPLRCFATARAAPNAAGPIWGRVRPQPPRLPTH